MAEPSYRIHKAYVAHPLACSEAADSAAVGTIIDKGDIAPMISGNAAWLKGVQSGIAHTCLCTLGVMFAAGSRISEAKWSRIIHSLRFETMCGSPHIYSFVAW